MKHLTRTTLLRGLMIVLLLTACTAAVASPTQAGNQTVTSPPSGLTSLFSDVPAGNSNVLFINYLANRDMIKGFPDGTFRPASGLTRAEAAAILVRAAGLNALSTQTRFSDVYAGYWASGSIEAAASAGLLSGYPDGTFRPENTLSRAEGLDLFLRLSKRPDPKVELPSLEDVAPNHWAARPVAVALAAGMAGLTADKQQFLPNAPFSRGDLARAMAVLLTREPALYQTNMEGKLKVLKGTVSLTQAGSQTATQIKDTATLKPAQTMITGPGSEAELVFPDGTGILIKEKTELTMNESQGRSYITSAGTPGIAVDWLTFKLKKGKIYGALASRNEAAVGAETKVETKEETRAEANARKVGITGLTGYPMAASLDNQNLKGIILAVAGTGKESGTLVAVDQAVPWWKAAQNKRVKVKVDMPWGVAAIRGTFWENSVDSSGRSTTSLLTGEGEVTSGGQTVQLTAGQRTEVAAAGAPPAQVAPMTAQDKQEWVEAKEWAPDRAQDIQTNQEPALPPPPPPVEQAQQPEQPQTLQPVEPPVQQQQQHSTLTNIVSGALRQAEHGASTSNNGGGSDSSDSSGQTDGGGSDNSDSSSQTDGGGSDNSDSTGQTDTGWDSQ